ncbi:MFS transporter small subunit [Alsobacter sp. SYSU BS001988]
MQHVDSSTSGTMRLVIAWSIAGIPLLVGVVQTIANAMKLFQ